MHRSILRTTMCFALLGSVAAATDVQAQAAQSTATLPDFTGIVQKNASAVVHVEAKYTGERQRAQQKQATPDQGDPDDAQPRYCDVSSACR